MRVQVLSRPQIVMETAIDLGYIPHPAGTVTPADELTEIAGRICYLSWGRPRPATATNAGYIENIVNQRHFSIMEHSCFTLAISGVSRSLAMEAIRHRHLSPSMQSQRYVDEADGEFITPIDIGEATELGLAVQDVHAQLVALYEDLVAKLEAQGLPRKRARQAARSILPNGHSTSLLLTGNVRAWRDFLERRLAYKPGTGEPNADLEIFTLAQWILFWLYQEAPHNLQDVWTGYGRWLETPAAETLAIRFLVDEEVLIRAGQEALEAGR